MKQYQLNIIQPQSAPPPPETMARIMKDVGAVVDEIRAKGAFVFTGGLTPPSSATVVRVRGEETLLTDGPFAETKEFIGGILVLRAPELDSALEWARKLSRATTLPIEVRPFQGEE